MAAEAAISSLVKLLGEQLINEVKSLRGVEGKVDLLKDELKRMQSFLHVANSKLVDDTRVSNWISEIREVAQEAEDTVEMFLLNVENEKSWRLLNSCRRFSHLHTIGEEIDIILAKLDAIDKSRERYKIDGLPEAASGADSRRLQVESWRRLPPWRREEHLVVGMDDDVKKLLRESILDEEKKGLAVAVVEGMGGIGKSTLARKIYNHPDVVDGRFDRRAWVVVSSEFRPRETIKQLILEVSTSEEDRKKMPKEIKKLEETVKDELFLQEKLLQMLHKQLEGTRYFIVLDDMWEKEHWDLLRKAFPHEQDKTSRVLLTTRIKDIAKCGEYSHEMKVLDNEESWELFLKKALNPKSYDKCPTELESIGRKIVEKCNGLPLAICVVGGLLMETQTTRAWEEALKRLNSLLGSGESRVSTILELSYLNLSPQLKSCFLSLAFFREDAKIPAKKLLHIWIGQGLIQQEGTVLTVEEIARGYLTDLINRNMVEIKDLTLDDRVKNCHVHDLIREVCLRKAKEEIGPRHRIVLGESIKTSSLHQNKHLRSLFLFKVNDDNVRVQSRYWKSFQLINILDLDGIHLRRFPLSFRSLTALKFLRLRCGANQTLELPRWLDRLKKLEVLDLKYYFVKLPNVTLKMDRLRFFLAFCVNGSKIIDDWKTIETLKYTRILDWIGCDLTLIESCQLRKLGIIVNPEEGQADELSKMRPSLEKLKNLEQLHLTWAPMFSSKPSYAHLNNLSYLGNLTELKLKGRIAKCPAATMFPPNLCRLVLKFHYLAEDPMAELGKITKLVYLKLSYNQYLGGRMHVLHDGFPCLKTLYLDTMFGLIIDIEEGGIAQLQHLRIDSCRYLEINNLPEHVVSSYVTS